MARRRRSLLGKSGTPGVPSPNNADDTGSDESGDKPKSPDEEATELQVSESELKEAITPPLGSPYDTSPSEAPPPPRSSAPGGSLLDKARGGGGGGDAAAGSSDEVIDFSGAQPLVDFGDGSTPDPLIDFGGNTITDEVSGTDTLVEAKLSDEDLPEGGASMLGRARGGAGGDGPAQAVGAPGDAVFGDGPIGGDVGAPGGRSDFQDFDLGGDGPPTEEVPSAVLEDLGQLYNASMSVPEPAPVPDPFDSEPPTEPAGVTDGQKPARPRDPFADDAELPRTPPPDRPMMYDSENDEEVDLEDSNNTVVLVAGVAAMFAVTGIIVFALNSGSADPVADAPPPEPAKTIEVIEEPPPPPPEPEEDTDTDATADAEGEGEGEGDTDGEDTEAAEAVAAPPTPRPKPQPKPEPTTTPEPTKTETVAPPPPPPEEVEEEPEEPEEKGAMGTIKVRSNKRVIVQVNGNLVDFAPVDLPFETGSHTVGAMLPGRPDTLQEKKVRVRKGKTASVNFDF